MASNNYITEFNETISRSEVTADKRIFVADQAIQHSLAQFNAQKETGTQYVICYQPENLDLVRWKLNKCIRDSGRFGNNDFTPQWERYEFVSGSHELSENQSSKWTRKEKFKIYRNDNYGLTGLAEWYYSISSSGPDQSYDGNYRNQPVASVFGNPERFPASVHNKVFTDHYTQLEGVSFFSDINNRTFGSVRPRYYDINPEYNFYIESFEDAVEDYVINEKALPNMYAFIMARDEKLTMPDKPEKDIYELHITLNNEIKKELSIQSMSTNALANNALQPFIKSKGQYFDKYSKAYFDFQLNQPDYNNTVNRFQNVIIPASDLEFYKRNKENKLNFPMYVDYEFSTDINTELADSFMTSRLSSQFTKDVVTAPTASGDFNRQSGSFAVIPVAPTYPIPQTQELNIWNISVWEESLQPAAPLTTGSSDMIFLGPYNEEIAVANNDPSFNFFKSLMTTSFKAQFQELVDEKTRTFEQILAGQKAYSETIFYEVEKWELDDEGNETTSEPIQSVYFPNSSEIDVHEYVDTQVAYGRNYVYRAKAYQAVFGTAYGYELDNVENGNATICVLTRPSVQLVEVPYFEKQTKIVDRPPVFPDVEIIPFRDLRNKVSFYLRGNVGDYDLEPVAIEFADNQKIQQVRDSQERQSPLPVNFKSDDQARFFEIFRLEEKPTSYLDFIDNKIATLSTTTVTDGRESAATSATFEDTILPNKKYYYVFRTIDVHENISNPTQVYQIEIIDNEGAPALVSEVYPIVKQKPVPQSSTKTAKKYVYIKLNEQQTVIDERKARLLDPQGLPVDQIPNNLKQQETASYLGITDRTAWDKDYKIRLTSKKTGKQIDFNVKYTTKVNRPTNGSENT